MPPPVTCWLPSTMDAMAEAEVKAALKAIGLESRKALKPEQGTVAPAATPVPQRRSGEAPRSARTETAGPPSPSPADAGALLTFSVTTAAGGDGELG